MHFSLASFLTTATFVGTAWSHGIITTPAPRAVGAASLAACGSGVTKLIRADNTSHVEGLPEIAATDNAYKAADCNLWLCKGLQLADNKANVQNFTAGQTLDMLIWIRIPHAGTANVSVVDTKTNQVIGEPLISFRDYADQSLPTLPKNNTNFSVTIPKGLEKRCATAGQCVSLFQSSLRHSCW